MYQSLHCHTKTSDGELNYQQVLDVCLQYNISVVAFTDHDALPNEKAIKLLEKNRDHKTKWILGIEISSGWPKEIGGPASNFHIVGLFVNPFDKNLKIHCQKAKLARIERMERMVKNLRSLGFEISKKDCLKESGGETVGRPHIVAALLKKERNLKIIEELKKKMEKEAKHDLKIKKLYETMIKAGKEQYPYFLFLDPKAFFPDIYVPYLYWKDMAETVKLIRDAGGVAILAHWTLSKNKVNVQMIEKFFREKRLDGAEIVFGQPGIIEKMDKKIKEEFKQDMEIMQKLTKKCGVLQGGGADLHKRQDFELFVKQKWFASKTIGLIQKMMKMRDLNLEFSSL